MKKLIAISVVFALVAGSVFAADVSGDVIGTVTLMEGSSGGGGVTSGAGMNRIRLEASGGDDEGKWGAWLRVEGSVDNASTDRYFHGYAWWKPIDQFKIWIGGNGGDGFFGKEGVTGWSFYQRLNDNGVGDGNGNSWGWGRGSATVHTRDAFYAGGQDGTDALYLTIAPVDMVSVNLQVPFFGHGGDLVEIFKSLVAQVDVNLSFGNIAITYTGDPGGNPTTTGANSGKLFGYFGLTAIDNLGLDFGIGFTLPKAGVISPVAVGLGAKYDVTDSFGFKFRTAMKFGGDAKEFGMLLDVLPYFGVSDSLKIFMSLGIGLAKPQNGDASLGWHINPYVQVGQEWGPSFWVGFRLDGNKPGGGTHAIDWAIPIALSIGF